MSDKIDTRRMEACMAFLVGKSFTRIAVTGNDPEVLCIRGYRTDWHDDWLTQEFHLDVNVITGYVRNEAIWTEWGRFDELEGLRESLPTGTALGILETCGWFPTLDEEMDIAQRAYDLVGVRGDMRFPCDILFNSFEYLV
jgi:hypothetical protein